MIRILVGFMICPLVAPISDWQPVVPPEFYGIKGSFGAPEPSFSALVAQRYQQPSLQEEGGQCELYKVGFTQDLYFQYIQYKWHVPQMKEFTLCYWSKFNNHSNDHPLFSYAVEGQPRSIYSWVSNTERSSYFSMAVGGQTFYRLNYPLRLNKWYHVCQSWNGKTGEWQIWVNAERVGRGFHNRLVGHGVPAGGVAITGQEQTQIGGGFLEGDQAPKGSGGMLGEVTMLQLYSVALTAGKAHKDHKHHHSTLFDHNGNRITTTQPPPPAPRPTLPSHPLLISGQLNTNNALIIATGGQPTQPPPQQPQMIAGQQFDAQFLSGDLFSGFTQQFGRGPQARGPQQFTPNALARPPNPPPPIVFTPSGASPTPPPQFQPPFSQASFSQPPIQLGSQTIELGKQPIILRGELQQPQQPPPQINFETASETRPLISSGLVHSTLTNPANVQFIDNTQQLETHQLFKRATARSSEKRGDKKTTPMQKKSTKAAIRSTTPSSAEEKKHTKRELYFDSNEMQLVDNSQLAGTFDQSLLDDGLAAVGQNEPILVRQQQQYDEREPAEAEVTAVMQLCSGCDEEPFEKALVFGWRTVPKKLYSGAFLMPAGTKCRNF